MSKMETILKLLLEDRKCPSCGLIGDKKTCPKCGRKACDKCVAFDDSDCMFCGIGGDVALQAFKSYHEVVKTYNPTQGNENGK